MMGKMLTAEHAVIHTAAVEVKTLTIKGRQVTLSVFRQLPLRYLLDDDTQEFLGVPWGRVNYFWDTQPRDALHVVWQHGSVLYRALMPPRRARAEWEREQQAVAEESATFFATVHLVNTLRHKHHVERTGSGATGLREWHPVYGDASMALTDSEIRSLAGMLFESAPEVALNALARRRSQPDDTYVAKTWEETGAAMARWIAAYQDCLRQRDARHNAYLRQWRILAALDQLFIAV